MSILIKFLIGIAVVLVITVVFDMYRGDKNE